MNLFSLAKTFPTEDAAVEYWIATRWPNGVRCVGCDHETVYRIQTAGKTGKPSLIFECGKCAYTSPLRLAPCSMTPICPCKSGLQPLP